MVPTCSSIGEHSRRMLKKARLLTRPTPADISPSRPESAKTASSPWDAPCPKQGRSELPLKGVGGMIPTARNFLTRPPTGTPRRAIRPGEGLPTPYTSLKGSGRGCPLLRASSDHRFIVGALRARRAPGCSLLILRRPRVARARGSSQPPRPFFSILLTQHRMNPVAHEVRDHDHADANDYMLRDDFPGRDLLGPRQEIAQHREQREAPHHAHRHGHL